MKIRVLLCVLGIFAANRVIGQTSQDTAKGAAGSVPAGVDTTQLPKLEIPEITIVGKKAITLPFARKGEIYDVTPYQAPPPDTSLLGDYQFIALPRGTLSRYEEHQMPWRASLEGSFGTFGTGSVRGYADYKTQWWGIFGNGGYRTTDGHTAGASASTSDLDVTAHSLLSTDNDLLRALRMSGGLGLRHDSYGMYGYPGEAPRRTRNNVSFDAGIGSVNREGNVLDLGVGAKIWKVTDSRNGIDSEASVVSPDVRASFASDAGDVRLGADVFYTSSSLDYPGSSQSPSLLGISAGARWRLSDQWFIHARGLYQDGSGSDGSSTTLVAPAAVLQWEASQDREWIFWFQPELSLPTYDDRIRENPYLVRGPLLKPEKRPVHLGSSLSYRDDNLTLRLSGSFTHSTDRSVTLADSGRITLGTLDADQVVVEASGALNPIPSARVKFSGALQPGHETGTTIQLPMVPILELRGRAEVDLAAPITIWSSAEYWSKRNVDRAGSRTLSDVFFMGAGASTRALPHMVISIEIANLFNSAYDRWEGYSAPGRQVTLDAKINLR